MVICNFYARGYCKFGQNCRYEHPRDLNNSYTSNNNQQNNQQQQQNKFKYYSNNNQQQQQHSGNQHTGGAYDDKLKQNEFLQTVNVDLSQWLNSNLWKLSCYSPFTNIVPPIPVFEDYSFEEIRLAMYQARNSNTLIQAIEEVKSKERNVIQCIQQMINLNADTRNYLLKYYDEAQKIIDDSKQQQQNQQQQQTSPLASLQTQKPSGGNLFANLINKQTTGIVNAAAPSPFFNMMQSNPQIPVNNNNNNTVFGQQPMQFNNTTNNNNSSAFGQQMQFNNNNQMFTQAQQQAVPTNPLQSLQTKPQAAPFIQPQSFQQQSVFAAAAAPNKFSQLMQQQTQINQPQAASQVQQSLYYSSQNDLNDEDMKEYSSNEFTLGRIPSNPPSENLIRKF